MPSKYKQIEDQRGKPMEAILCELYEKHRNIYKVADELGVTQPTVSNWIMRCRLEFRTILAHCDLRGEMLSVDIQDSITDAYPYGLVVAK